MFQETKAGWKKISILFDSALICSIYIAQLNSSVLQKRNLAGKTKISIFGRFCSIRFNCALKEKAGWKKISILLNFARFCSSLLIWGKIVRERCACNGGFGVWRAASEVIQY